MTQDREKLLQELEGHSRAIGELAAKSHKEHLEFLNAPSIGQATFQWTRTALEVVRNFLVVCALNYAGTISGKWYLSGLAWCIQLIFFMYLISFVYDKLEWFRRPRGSPWLERLMFTLFAFVTFVGLYALIIAVNITVDEVVRTQTK